MAESLLGGSKSGDIPFALNALVRLINTPSSINADWYRDPEYEG